MKIEKLMTRDVRTCRPEDRLVEPARIMWEIDCGCVPVVDAQLSVIGMITDRDVCMAAYTQGGRLDEMPVQTAMSKTVHECRPSDDVKVAEELMKTEQVHRLPVVNDDGRLVGLLSLNDLACEASNGRSSRDRQVMPEEVGLTLAAICAHRQGVAEKVVQPSAKRPPVGAGSRAPNLT